MNRTKTWLRLRINQRGMTLIELMVVVTVIAILGTIAIPSYRRYMIRSSRTEATSALMAVQAAQEKFFLQANRYAANLSAAPPAGLGLPVNSSGGSYAIALNAPNDVTYRATATPVAGKGQQDDHDCVSFNLDQTGAHTAVDNGGADSTSACWH